MTQDRVRIHLVVVALCGLLLIAVSVALAILSDRFAYGSPLLDRPHLIVVSILVFGGAVYLCAIPVLRKLPTNKNVLIGLVAVGLLLRLPYFFSNPIQEDDFYRYLWDGALTANGHNPYSQIPAHLLEEETARDLPEDLRELAASSGGVIYRVNHPELATVYPPVSQAVFAAAHAVAPWSLGGWRAVLLVFDAATLLVLFLILRKLKKPAVLAAVYWWNPLVVKETFNSAHMDVIALPFVLAALLFALQHRPTRSGVALALAAGAKIWPLLLAPIFLGGIKATPRKLLAAVSLAAVVLGIITAPMAAARFVGSDSGVVAYSEYWEMNDALFMGLAKVAEFASGPFGFDERGVHWLARIFAAGLVVAWTGWWAFRNTKTPQAICDTIVLSLAALFMLSPTQFPWYYIWIVPFLALSPRPSMLVLTAALPVYYLKFYFDARDNVSFFHNTVVWLEFAPVFVLATWEVWIRWKTPVPNEAV